MSNRFVDPGLQYGDNILNPLSGGLLYFFVTGTSTPATTYSEPTLTTPNANPVVLDSAGRAGNIFLDPSVTYRAVLKDSTTATTFWTKDNIVDPAANVTAEFQVYAGNPNGFVAGTAGSVGGSGASVVYDITNNVVYIATTTGNAATTVWTPSISQLTGQEDIRTSTHTVILADRGRTQTANSASAITFNLTAAATLGAGFMVAIKNIGLGVLTIDPAGAELVDGVTTITLAQNNSAILYNMGSAWRTIGLTGSLFSSDPGAAVGPTFTLHRASASPAASDLLGQHLFTGLDSGAALQTYADIVAKILDPTAASEDGALLLRAVIAGTLTAIGTFGPGLQIGTPAGGDKGAGTINVENGIYKGGSLAQITAGALHGLTISNGTDATNDFNIAAGVARDSTDAYTMVLSTALGKQLDAVWALGGTTGTPLGGRDAGATVDGYYHVFLIARSDTGVVDALLSLSATAPTMPANYDYKRRIGSVIRTGSANVAFTQNGDEFLRSVPLADYAGAGNLGTSAITVTLTGIPVNIVVDAIMTATLRDGSNGGPTNMLVTALTQTDTAPSITLHDTRLPTGTGGNDSASTYMVKRTNTSAQFRYRLDASTVDHDVTFMTHGWRDTRGRLA